MMRDDLAVPDTSAVPSPGDARRPYHAPAIVALGDLRDLTLGGSPGVGDSGSGSTQKCPGC